MNENQIFSSKELQRIDGKDDDLVQWVNDSQTSFLRQENATFRVVIKTKF